jgi:hypothetical protein
LSQDGQFWKGERTIENKRTREESASNETFVIEQRQIFAFLGQDALTNDFGPGFDTVQRTNDRE